MEKRIKYIKDSSPLLEKNTSSSTYKYCGGGLVLEEKNGPFKIVKEFSSEVKEQAKLEIEEKKKIEDSIVYAEEIFSDDEDLYGQNFNDIMLDKKAHRNLLQIGQEMDEFVLGNGLQTDLSFKLLCSMQFSRLICLSSLSFEAIKTYLSSVNKKTFIFEENGNEDISKERQILSAFEYAINNKTTPIFVYLHDFSSKNVFNYLRPLYNYIDNPEGDNYFNAFGKLTYIPHNLYFIISLKNGEYPYEITRKLLRYISFAEAKGTIIEEKTKFNVKTFSLEEIYLSMKESGMNFSINDDLWKKVDGLVKLISQTNGYFIQNKIEIRLENYLVALGNEVEDNFELLDKGLSANLAVEAFICKDPSLYETTIDIEKYLNNSFGEDKMPLLRKQFNAYLSYIIKSSESKEVLDD